MKIFVSSLDAPVGYTTPKFPSLYWPLGSHTAQYEQLFLYYLYDIWRFTVFWFLILYGGMHAIAATMAIFNQNFSLYRHRIPAYKLNVFWAVLIFVTYLVIGLAQGLASGAVIGLLLQAIYHAGSLTMSTWIPFTWSAVGTVFLVCMGYLTSSIIL